MANMTNAMTKAWTIAYKGQKRFGGKVKEYFATALKMAWAIFKKGAKAMNKVKGTLRDINFADLKGSEKQVSWAKDIRSKAIKVMEHAVMTIEFTPQSVSPMDRPKAQTRPVKEVAMKMLTEESIQMHLNDLEGIRLDKEINKMNGIYDRYNRFAEVLSNDSAKFWIDNRDDQEKNYMFKEFVNYIKTGVKNF